MDVRTTPIPGLLHVAPRAFGDARGFFLETFQAERYAAHGIPGPGLAFVQDNQSRSGRGILRGLHFQNPHAQGKLVWAGQGRVYDVVVDIRRGSPAFGQWYGAELSDENHHQLWVPPGVAHGFCVLSDTADFCYKCTETYHPEAEGVLRWDDPDLGIAWPVARPRLNDRDAAAPRLRDLPAERLLPFA